MTTTEVDIKDCNYAMQRKWRTFIQRLGKREQEYGYAWVDYLEGSWLTRNGLRQPGHTKYRYSTPGEDLSDKAQI